MIWYQLFSRTAVHANSCSRTGRENIAVIGSRSSFKSLEGVNRVTREEMKIVVSREAVVKDDYNNLIAKSCNEMSVDC